MTDDTGRAYRVRGRCMRWQGAVVVCCLYPVEGNYRGRVRREGQMDQGLRARAAGRAASEGEIKYKGSRPLAMRDLQTDSFDSGILFSCRFPFSLRPGLTDAQNCCLVK